MKKEDQPISIEQDFNASPGKVWTTLTNPEEMRKWFFPQIENFEPKVGFETQFTVENEGRVFPHLWKITEVIPNKKIVYNWRYGGYKGDSSVSFELTPADGGSRLKLTHEVTEDFPGDVEEFSRENCHGGWNWFIKNRLKQYLEAKD